MKVDTALLFAAGFGKRMLPLTLEIPKPMVKVAGKMLIESALERLQEAGIKHVVVNTHHLADKINSWLETRKDSGLKISISHERHLLLDTAGGIVQALPLLGAHPFFTINGDILWHDRTGAIPILERMSQQWDHTKMDILMLLCPKEKAVGYEGKGDFSLTKNGTVCRTGGGEPYVYCGIQLIEPSLFKGQPVKPFSLREIYDAKKQSDGSYDRIFGLVYDGHWSHVGTVADIERAEKYLVQQGLSTSTLGDC
jgi:N-acetyl-alpha-D-muramate 1-phosphate uridylyltransferase